MLTQIYDCKIKCLSIFTTNAQFVYVALFDKKHPNGSVAEWSKALVLGTSLLGGVGSNPTTAMCILLNITIY